MWNTIRHITHIPNDWGCPHTKEKINQLCIVVSNIVKVFFQFTKYIYLKYIRCSNYVSDWNFSYITHITSSKGYPNLTLWFCLILTQKKSFEQSNYVIGSTDASTDIAVNSKNWYLTNDPLWHFRRRSVQFL